MISPVFGLTERQDTSINFKRSQRPFGKIIPPRSISDIHFGPVRSYILQAMKTVLVIDDDAESSEPLVRYLAQAGHGVTYATNGQEALAMLNGEIPDVVILDLQMPVMDGIGFLRVLRSYLRWDHIPVFIWTAYPESAAVIRAEDLGACQVFPKAQLNFGQIKAVIDQCVGGA